MPKLEQLQCASKSYNQGFGRCVTDYGQLLYMVALPKGRVLSALELEDIGGTLEMLAKADNPQQRAYLIGRFVNYENTNTEAATETLSNNKTIYTDIGTFGWNVRVLAGGTCAWKNLLKFHQAQDSFDFLLFHDGGILAGVRVKDNTGEWGMKGVALDQIMIPNFVGATATTTPVYQMNVIVGDSAQMRELYTFVSLKDEGIDIATVMQPLMDIELNAIQTAVDTWEVEAIAGCGGGYLTDLYGTEMASATMWKLTNSRTGADIDIDSVSVNGDKFVIVADDSDPDFPTSGGKITINTAPISVLEQGGVIGFEGQPVTVTVSGS